LCAVDLEISPKLIVITPVNTLVQNTAYLHTIIPSSPTQLRRFPKPLRNLLNLRYRQRPIQTTKVSLCHLCPCTELYHPSFSQSVNRSPGTHRGFANSFPAHFLTNCTSHTHGPRIQRLPPLPPRMAQLCYQQAPMCLRHPHHLPIFLDTSIVVVAQDRVTQSLNGIVWHHGVTLDDHPDSTFAPAPVEVNEFGRWDAAAGNIFIAPVAKAFGHGGF
jgi:hypothetical protein